MHNIFRRTATAIALLAAGAVQAGTIGVATVNDVTLDGVAARYISYASDVNPQAGKNGNSSGFASAFSAYGSGDWLAIAKFVTGSDGVSSSANVFGSVLTVFFDQTTPTNGTWQFTNADSANDVKLDLVFAMHTGGGSGAWLFDDKVINSGNTIDGTWKLNLYNDGGNIGDYSNLTIFTRNFVATPKALAPVDTPAGTGGGVGPSGGPGGAGAQPETRVPEPASIASLALGLGIMGLVRRRKRSR